MKTRKFFQTTKKGLLTLGLFSIFASAQTTRDLYVVHKNLIDQPTWYCGLNAIDTKVQGADLVKQYKNFLYRSYATFIFEKGVDKLKNSIIRNKGNSWAREFNFQSSTSNALVAIGATEPQAYAEDKTIDAQNVMILTNSGTPTFLTANLYERLNYKDTNGAIVRTENNLVSTLYCYSEINLKLALKSLGKDDADFVKGKELQDFREYLDLRPDSADKLEELTEHNLERDAWLQH